MDRMLFKISGRCVYLQHVLEVWGDMHNMEILGKCKKRCSVSTQE